MKLYNIIRRLKLFVPAMALAVLASCQDELFQELDYTSSGEDVTLTVPISMPEMTPLSRSELGDNQLTQVNSLWIAVFSTSGEMTSQKNAMGEIGWYKVQNASNGGYEIPHEVTLNAKTGPSYIVAVANVENQGVKMNTDGSIEKTGALSDLLTDGMTWTDFLSIGAAAPSDLYDVNAPRSASLPMSGCYTGIAVGGDHPADWQSNNFLPVDIPKPTGTNANVKFPENAGAIHLRRLVSHINFNISIGTEATDIIDVEVLSYRVCNIPKLSWLYERGTDVESTDGRTNIGDNAKDYKNAEDNYQTSINFSTAYIKHNKIDRLNPGTATFDFWMGENKHTGIIDPDNSLTESEAYNQREAKYKDGDTYTNPALYTSLVNESRWTANNMATYVVLTCNVTYRNQLNVDENGNQSGQNTNDVYRTGVAEYTVHLGYIGGIANDFNSYRNSNYTYNVTITGLESIRLEAIREGERNAAEGVVTDVVNPTVTLDSHSHTFNIVLTSEELTTNANQLGYIITTYESGNAHTFTYEQYRDQTADNPIDAKYMNWVEIKPTTSANVYADYVPAQGDLHLSTQSDANRVMTIQDFIDLIRGKKNTVNGLNKQQLLNAALNNGNYYFTVFVNEYSYELRYGESGNPNNSLDVYGNEDAENRWTTYINQNPRRFYLLTQKAESTDGNSIYSRSKYAIQQRSMQSFYSMTDFNDNKTAFALEHINETQGLNMRVTYIPTSGLDELNGLYNVWNWVGGNNGERAWNTFVSLNSPQQIPNVSDLQGGPAIASLSAMNPAINNPSSVGFTHLPTTVQLGGREVTSAIPTSNQSAYDPQPQSSNRAYYIEAINACMNRNRDENGNGVIDAPELKWYVPASGKYLRAIIGRASLMNPIMPYDQVENLPKANNALNSRYLVYASNNYFLWAMEGLAASPLATDKNSDFLAHDNEEDDEDIWMQPAWQVRCIRNLGTNLTNVTSGEKVTVAYEHDDKNREITLTNYDPASIRQIKYTVGGNSPNTPYAMTIHPVTSEMNRLYPAFQYTENGFVSTQYITFNYNRTTGGNTRISGYAYITTTDPCSTVTEGGYSWRLPNQKELAIMRNLGILGNLSGAQYALSCTYDYYDITGKNGGSDFLLNNSPNHYFMGSRANGGTRLSASNLDNNNGRQVYIRCVRDIDP